MKLSDFLNSGGSNRPVNRRGGTRPLYTEPLVFEDENGEYQPVLQLPGYPIPEAGGSISLTPRVAEIIIRAARAGNSIKASCAFAGIHPRRLYEWRDIATSDPVEGESEYAVKLRAYLLAFFNSYDMAFSLAEVEMLQIVHDAATGQLPSAKKRTVEKITYPKGGVQKREVEEEIIAAPDAKAAMWILERTRAGTYGPRKDVNVELTGEGGGPVEVNHTNKALELVAETIESIRKDQLALARANGNNIVDDTTADEASEEEEDAEFREDE